MLETPHKARHQPNASPLKHVPAPRHDHPRRRPPGPAPGPAKDPKPLRGPPSPLSLYINRFACLFMHLMFVFVPDFLGFMRDSLLIDCWLGFLVLLYMYTQTHTYLDDYHQYRCLSMYLILIHAPDFVGYESYLDYWL